MAISTLLSKVGGGHAKVAPLLSGYTLISILIFGFKFNFHAVFLLKLIFTPGLDKEKQISEFNKEVTTKLYLGVEKCSF